jgi:hypothetical protein
VKDDVQKVAGQVAAEAHKRVKPETSVVFISDGDHRMRKPMLKALKASACPNLAPDKVPFIVDLIHALERLWSAAHALFGESHPEVEPWVTKQLGKLLQGRASTVAQTMRRQATYRKLTGNRRKKLDKAANYLLKYKNNMRYDVYLAKGYPIASGVIEGACKHVVKDRCERSDARWGLEGADALLKLRSIRLSGDWDAFWRFYRERDQNMRWEGLSWKNATSQPDLRLVQGGISSS